MKTILIIAAALFTNTTLFAGTGYSRQAFPSGSHTKNPYIHVDDYQSEKTTVKSPLRRQPRRERSLCNLPDRTKESAPTKPISIKTVIQSPLGTELLLNQFGLIINGYKSKVLAHLNPMSKESLVKNATPIIDQWPVEMRKEALKIAKTWELHALSQVTIRDDKNALVAPAINQLQGYSQLSEYLFASLDTEDQNDARSGYLYAITDSSPLVASLEKWATEGICSGGTSQYNGMPTIMALDQYHYIDMARALRNFNFRPDFDYNSDLVKTTMPAHWISGWYGYFLLSKSFDKDLDDFDTVIKKQPAILTEVLHYGATSKKSDRPAAGVLIDAKLDLWLKIARSAESLDAAVRTLMIKASTDKLSHLYQSILQHAPSCTPEIAMVTEKNSQLSTDLKKHLLELCALKQTSPREKTMHIEEIDSVTAP